MSLRRAAAGRTPRLLVLLELGLLNQARRPLSAGASGEQFRRPRAALSPAASERLTRAAQNGAATSPARTPPDNAKLQMRNLPIKGNVYCPSAGATSRSRLTLFVGTLGQMRGGASMTSRTREESSSASAARCSALRRLGFNDGNAGGSQLCLDWNLPAQSVSPSH